MSKKHATTRTISKVAKELAINIETVRFLIVPDLGEILRWVGKNSLDGFLRMMEKQTVGELLVS